MEKVKHQKKKKKKERKKRKSNVVGCGWFSGTCMENFKFSNMSKFCVEGEL
jgi:hypothetical protein